MKPGAANINPSRIFLERSCAWIRDHWNAANQDVPDELLCQWIYRRNDDDADPSAFYLAVFTFGFLQHDLISHNVPPGVQRTHSASELLRLFEAWQMKLALVEIHRKTDLRMKPLPLFSFSEDEQVEFWRVDNRG